MADNRDFEISQQGDAAPLEEPGEIAQTKAFSQRINQIREKDREEYEQFAEGMGYPSFDAFKSAVHRQSLIDQLVCEQEEQESGQVENTAINQAIKAITAAGLSSPGSLAAGATPVNESVWSMEKDDFESMLKKAKQGFYLS